MFKALARLFLFKNKKQKTIYCILVYLITCMWFQEKKSELNRYKDLINGKIIFFNIIRYIFEIMFDQYNYISMI